MERSIHPMSERLFNRTDPDAEILVESRACARRSHRPAPCNTPLAMPTFKLGKLLLLVLVSIGALSITGCATVAPYERGILALPTMAPEDVSTGFDEHVRAVSEGSTGGFGGGGGGCGCN